MAKTVIDTSEGCGCKQSPCTCNNPIDEVKKKWARHSHFSHFAELPNPILKEVSEKNEGYNKTFRLLDMVVPYYGDNNHNAHGFLEFLMGLPETSPTQWMCWQSRRKSAFGGRVKLVKGDTEYYSGEELNDFETNLDDFKLFVEGIEFEFDSVRELAECVFDNLFLSGNAYIEVELKTVTVGNVTENFAYLYLHSPTHCLYLRTKRGEPRIIAISPFWNNFNKLAEDNAVTIPVYPAVIEESKGSVRTVRTIFHLKNKTPQRVYYGVPDTLASFQDQYRERQDKTYLCKESANGWTGTNAVEAEESDDEKDDIRFSEMVNDKFSNKGEGKRVMVTFRPKGATPWNWHSLPANTNEKFYEVTQQIHEKSIIGTNLLSRIYLGIENAKGGQGSNAYEQEVKRININVVEPDQNKVGGFLTKIFRYIAESSGYEAMKDYKIDFTNPVMDRIELENEQLNNIAGDSTEGADE